jgi:hypothetical protein
MDGSLTMTLTNGGNLLALDATTSASNISLGVGEGATPPLDLEVDTVLNMTTMEKNWSFNNSV